MKKLIEGIQFYRDKLHEPVVFERFNEILTKVGLSYNTNWKSNEYPQQARGNKSKDKPDSELNEFEQASITPHQ